MLPGTAGTRGTQHCAGLDAGKIDNHKPPTPKYVAYPYVLIFLFRMSQGNPLQFKSCITVLLEKETSSNSSLLELVESEEETS